MRADEEMAGGIIYKPMFERPFEKELTDFRNLRR